MATLASMRALVKFQLGNKTGIDSIIDSNLNYAIIEYILTRRPQEAWTTDTLTLSSATAEYAFSSMSNAADDVLAVMFVRNQTEDVRIRRGSVGHYVLLKQDTTVSSNLGQPNRWARVGNTLILYSLIPDSTSRTVKVWYLKRPTELSADADTFPLNYEHERPIAVLAAAYTWADMNNMEKFQVKYNLYTAMLSAQEKPESIEEESPEAQLVPISNVR